MNPAGHPESLEPSRAGNTHAAKHGAYSARLRQDRADEVADAVMSASHVTKIDLLGAHEVGQIVALCDALDEAIELGGVIDECGKPRAVVDLRLRASRRLGNWLDQYGFTPKAKADYVLCRKQARRLG